MKVRAMQVEVGEAMGAATEAAISRREIRSPPCSRIPVVYHSCRSGRWNWSSHRKGIRDRRLRVSANCVREENAKGEIEKTY